MSDTDTQPETALATVPITILEVLNNAASTGASVETMERLVALKERMDSADAAKLFAAAFAAFKEECPPVPRKTENAYFKVERNGVKVSRMYASLEDIEATVRGPLGKHGLSYRWGDVVASGDHMTITCIISHAGGHSVQSTTPMTLENKAGCSPQQKYGIAYTYAQRYSLIQALGLTSCDEDADGNQPETPEPVVTENQAANLQALIDEVKADKAAFLRWAGCASLAEVPASKFPAAVAALQAKRGGTKK